MEKMSIKTTILLPVIVILVIGIVIMTVIVSSVSSSTTNDLSNRLVSARVNEYANKFESMCVDSYGVASALAPSIQNIAETGDHPREEAISLLTSVLKDNEELVSIWSVWEPNAFDGMDSKYAGTPNHDTTGRFIPFVCKEGSAYIVGNIPDYETGDFYLGARNSGKPYITDPYECEFGGKMIPVYTITFPIIKNGMFVGAIGIDIDPAAVIAEMNKGSILDEGYLYVISPGGLISTHRNSDLILKGYDETWLKDYKTEINSILANGGSFAVDAFSDQINEKVRFLASGVMIGETGRYWFVCGLVPDRVVTTNTTKLVRNVVLIGVILTLVVGLTVFCIVRGGLKKLPLIEKAAGTMAKGEINLSGLESGTYPTRNEITLLGRAFYSMADGIKEQTDIMSQIADGDCSMTVHVRSEADTAVFMNPRIDFTRLSLSYWSSTIKSHTLVSLILDKGVRFYCTTPPYHLFEILTYSLG